MNNWLKNYRTEIDWSDYQQKVFSNLAVGKNMLIEARAGSGKTTLLEGIVAELLNQNPRYRVLLLAFNRHIAQELKNRKRIPKNCEIKTSHGFGYKLLRNYGYIYSEPDTLKIGKLVNEAIDKIDKAESNLPRLRFGTNYLSRQKRIEFVRNLKRLVDLAKNNFSQTDEELDVLREKYNFKSISKLERYWLYRCLRWILKKDEKLATRGEIDYGDMLYLPHIWDIKADKYDFVLVDELQDSNLAQIYLYKNLVDSGATFIGVGDRHQAIYLFAGSCADSWTTLQFLIRCSKYTLPICYRCSHQVLKYAKKLVDIQAAPLALKGEVKEIKREFLDELVKPGQLVLSRLNAPLISTCLGLIVRGKKAKVRGKNVGKYLLEFINRFIEYPSDFPDVWHLRMREYSIKRIDYLLSLGAELEARDFEDVYDSLEYLYRAFVVEEQIDDLEVFKAKILSLFDDNEVNCVILSSIHRAKGDEAHTVYLLDAGDLPYKIKDSNQAELEQESNLVYVAITRAKHTLYFVDGKPDI